jgi:HAD superfamily hydrolase (TIGR01490 family)
VHRLGDVPLGRAFVIAEHQRDPLPLRQALHRVPECIAQREVRTIVRCLPKFEPVLVLANDLLVASERADRVDHCTLEVDLEGTRVAQRVAFCGDAEEGVVRDILGQRRITGQQNGEAPGRAHVRAVQGVERRSGLWLSGARGDLHTIGTPTCPYRLHLGSRLVEAAFFDLDKTVIATSSVLALGGTFYREGLVSKRTIVRGLYAQVLYLLVGADENKMDRMREAMLTLTRGWDQQHVKELVRETLDEVLTPIIYAEALELIDEHRKAGRKTVIISSSPHETVEPIGEYLGVDDVIATRARVDAQGRYTGELEFYAYAAQKAEAIREMAVAEGIDLANSYAYSDSITDLPMLELVGNPVAVNPDRELARVAREREWEVRYFQRPVRLRDRVPVPPKGPTIAAGSVAVAIGSALVLYMWLRKRATTPA